jgi:hypothetical protein
MKRSACTAVLLLAAAGSSLATDCQVKGFEFIAAARDNMLSVLTAKVTDGQGECTVVSDALVSGGAASGPGVTCEATFFAGAALKEPWKIQKIKFGGAPVVFAPPPGFPSQSLQVTVQTRADASSATSLSLEHVLLTTTQPNCRNWRDAFKG